MIYDLYVIYMFSNFYWNIGEVEMGNGLETFISHIQLLILHCYHTVIIPRPVD